MPYRETRLRNLQEFLECCHSLYLWTYGPDMTLQESSCPEEALLDGMIASSDHWGEILQNLHLHHKPFVISNGLGLTWITSGFFHKDELERIHILGPFFMYDVSAAHIEVELRRKKLSPELMRSMLQFLRSLPVISLTRVMEYGVMFHYAITEQRLSLEEIRFQDDHTSAIPLQEAQSIHGTYEREREMLRLVREGDLNFKTYANSLGNHGHIGNIADGTTLRQLKNMIITSIVLISRAAMEGGLPPETAYSLSDRYLQAVEKSTSIQSIIDINSAMQDDFIQRVHQFRQNSDLSMPIRVCIDRIRSRIEEDISLEQLAKDSGYSTYYLSRKFREETGQPFKTYLRQLRLERAKELLRTTGDSVLEISERLHFCSQSYFSDIFRKAYGISPTAYREQL